MTPTTPSITPAAPQSEASKIIGLLFTVGVGAVSIFVKNPNHLTTAGNILGILEELLPAIESII